MVEVRDKRAYINRRPVNDTHAHFEGDDTLGGPIYVRDDYGPRRVPGGARFRLGRQPRSKLR